MTLKMKALACALMLAGPAAAQDSTQAQAPATAPAAQVSAAPARDADPALWVVKDDDTTIYLFGTVHVLQPGLSWFDEAVKTAFDKSDAVVLEINAPDPAAMQKLVMSRAIDMASKPLSTRLPDGKGEAYLKAMAGIGVPAAAAEHFKPWFAATLLSVAPLQKLGYDPNNGPEHVLTEAAEKTGKKLGALETAEQQFGFLDGLSEDAQIQFLLSTLNDQGKLRDMMNQMVGDWAKGDPMALAKLLNEDLTDSPELKQTLLTNRNMRWADWIDARMKQPGTVFIAVGAGHLAGDNSVQNQLAKHHIEATRINY